jgi:hypothetical protein
MTKKEMLELIKDLKDDGPIYFDMEDGCCGETETMDVTDTHVRVLPKRKESNSYSRMAVILFASLPGYRSCIQSSITRDADKEYWEKHNPSKLQNDSKKENK